MKEKLIKAVLDNMKGILSVEQEKLLQYAMDEALVEFDVCQKLSDGEIREKENAELLDVFISAKKIEGCSDKTLHYYKSSIEKLMVAVNRKVQEIETKDIRCYLAEQQENHQLSKVTIDNLRRIFSSFFSWLEDEDYIMKSPVRRIHKVRTDTLVKEIISDENMEVLRDSCQ